MAFGSHSPIRKPSGVTVPRDPGVRGHVPVTGKLSHLLAEWEAYAAPLTLTPSQQRFAQLFFTGSNVLLTGEAGTGKSYLTKALFAFLTSHGVNVGITGLTGVAAFGIGGQTLHSFCGVGLADEPVANLLAKVFKNSKAKARMRAVDVLFIDEVSMAKGDLLNKVEEVFRAVRHTRGPWGGVQLVFIADWLQLPPVFRGDEVQELAFQCAAWRAAQVKTVVLKEQMRQKGDSTLLKVLNDLRVGDTSSLHLLDSRIGATFPDDGIEAVRVFCRNVDVDRYNAERLEAITSAPKVYRARDTGQPYHTDAFNKNCPAPEVLELKVGAQVMLLVNVDTEQGLVNGSIGVVKAFGPGGVTVQFKSGTAIIEHNEWQIKEQEAGSDNQIRFKVVATRTQIPLKLAWASTVHKTQGMTLDRAIVDVADAFDSGMAYVALSRVRDMESLSIAGPIPARAVRVNQHCVRFYEELDGLDE